MHNQTPVLLAWDDMKRLCAALNALQRLYSQNGFSNMEQSFSHIDDLRKRLRAAMEEISAKAEGR
ncbi:MAG: hypothetical protein ACK5QX_10595 [bacterium]